MATAEKKEIKITKAKQGFLRQTARKVRRTVNLIRGMKAKDAQVQLKFLAYAAAHPVSKLLKSVMANAKANDGVEDPGELFISEFLVDDGPMFKRFRAVSRGRAHSIVKRTSQLSIVLSELTPAEYAAHIKATSPRMIKGKVEKPKKVKKAKAATKTAAKPKTEKKESAKADPKAKKETKPAAKKPAAKKDIKSTAKKPVTKQVNKKSEGK